MSEEPRKQTLARLVIALDDGNEDKVSELSEKLGIAVTPDLRDMLKMAVGQAVIDHDNYPDLEIPEGSSAYWEASTGCSWE